MRKLLCITSAVLSLSTYAQKECGSTVYQELVRKQTPSAYLLSTITQSTSSSPSAASNAIITIPVVVHVVYNDAAGNISDEQIKSQIDALNVNFNKENKDLDKAPAVFSKLAGAANIRFVLAKVDPVGRGTNGITRTKTSRLMWSNDDKVKTPADGGVAPWDAKNYLNIWVCNTVPGLLGYSSAPGSVPEKDGVVIKTTIFGVQGGTGSFSMGRTAVHEVGHWLNLKHLWGDAQCGSDEVDDTPKQKTFNQGSPTFPLINGGCSAGNPHGDMFMNFMDFTNDASMMLFTQGQVLRMRAVFANGGPRQSLLNSKALGEPWNNTPAIAVTLPSATIASVAELKLYPNPAIDRITISGSGETGISGKAYVVYAADGRAVSSGKINSSVFSLPVSGLHRGLYMIRLGDDRDKQILRFMKQ